MNFSPYGVDEMDPEPAMSIPQSAQWNFPPNFEGMYMAENFREATRLARQLLLESEFQNHHQPTTLQDIQGQLLQYALDPDGSQFIQYQLTQCSTEEKDALLHEALFDFHQIASDPSGTYVLQHLFQYGDENHRSQIADVLLQDLELFCTTNYMFRIVEKALQFSPISPAIQSILCSRLRPLALPLMTHMYGNHIIQRAFYNAHFLESVLVDLLELPELIEELSTHQFGCRVLQKALTRCNSAQKLKIIEILTKNLLHIARHKCGNYTAQTMIRNGGACQQMLVEHIAHNLLEFSVDKFSSNVVETCIDVAAHRGILISEACANNGKILTAMLLNEFANYPAARMLRMANLEQRNEIVRALAPNVAQLRANRQGRDSLAKFQYIIGGLFKLI